MGGHTAGQPRRGRQRALLAGLALALAGFVALGHWQLERRIWKLALIERVEARLQAAPVAAPGPGAWASVGRDDEYRRVSVSGRLRHERETCTQAVTVRGPGCWVMTPLETGDGWIVLVNRGFVDPAHRDPGSRPEHRPEAEVEVAGLLRLSEPRGGFLRRNDPVQGRWYSRDVMAIGAARGLPAGRLAPYFIDADRDPDDPAGSGDSGPVGGMTVLRFHNSHLVYALTWFGLAVLTLAGMLLVIRPDWHACRRVTDAGSP